MLEETDIIPVTHAGSTQNRAEVTLILKLLSFP
jgi:hypothetical protein